MTTDTGITDDDLDTDDQDDDDDDGQSQTLQALRRRFDKSNARHAKEKQSLADELAKVKRELLLGKAGLPELSESRIKALLAAHEGKDETPEAIRQTAADLGWIDEADVTTDEPEVGEKERESAQAQSRISAAASGAKGSQSGVLQPGEVEDWPQERLIALLDKYPEEAEALMRGEQVNRPPGF